MAFEIGDRVIYEGLVNSKEGTFSWHADFSLCTARKPKPGDKIRIASSQRVCTIIELSEKHKNLIQLQDGDSKYPVDVRGIVKYIS